jgi:hypothetical protein
MGKSKNDLAWGKIFKKHKILDKIVSDSYFEITSKHINEFREARLMTKFDHKSQLPTLFSKNKLSILPTSRGSYVIGEFETFHKFNEDDIEITKKALPESLESINHLEITSEAAVINYAFVSGILQDFSEEKQLWPTVSGRMKSSSFSFKINTSKKPFDVKVENSQIEIDGGYEGKNTLILIEAKINISKDFIVRQLYYPFKLWSSKIQKKVRPIFLTYSNGIFNLREYKFTDVNNYNSLKLVKQKKYVLHEGTFNLQDLSKIIDISKTSKEPEIPFPQADSFERIINLCELLNQKEFIAKEDITEKYDFDSRQTDYYSSAGRYLGLIETDIDQKSGQTGCLLTNYGKQVFSLSLIDRQKEFIKLIVSKKAFKDTLKQYLANGEMPKKHEIVEIMKKSNLYNIDSETTYSRRASTIISWINWILNQTKEKN